MDVYDYDAVAIAAGILANCQMRAINYNHVPCLTEKSHKGNLCLQLTIRQMHELALQYVCSGNTRLRELIRLKLQFKT